MKSGRNSIPAVTCQSTKIPVRGLKLFDLGPVKVLPSISQSTKIPVRGLKRAGVAADEVIIRAQSITKIPGFNWTPFF